MVSKNQPAWLPSGWKLQIKVKSSRKFKCFIDPSSGSKFYSKPEVLRYLQSTQNSAGPSGREERRSTRHSSSNFSLQRPIDQQKSQESNVEQKQKVSQNSKTTSSKRLSSGKKERPVDQRLAQESNIEQNVLQNSNATASRRLSLRNKEVVIENTVDKDLPSGWIKEMRKKCNGTQARTDPFYFHPASGLVFRSKREVLCYLNTGEISRHAYWRKSKVDKEDCTIEKTSPTPLVKRETTTKRKTRNDLFAGEETSKVSPSSTPETRVVKDATVGRITRSSSRPGPASVSEAKPNHTSLFTRNDCFAGEETFKVSPSTPETRVVKEATVGRITRSSSRLGPASVSEVKPNHSSLFTRNELIAGEETSKVSPSSTPEARVVKETTVGRITRSSSRLGPASVSEAKPNQSSSLHKTANISEETIKTTKTKDQKMTPSTPAMSKLKVENTITVSMKGCSNKKAQTTKWKTNDQKMFTTPSHSSKRLTGVDVQPVFLSIPIEHALRPTTKKSKQAKQVANLVSVSNDLQEKPKPLDPEMHKVFVCQPTKQCTLDASSETVLATEEPLKNSDSLLQSAPPVVLENVVIDVPPNTEQPLEISRNHPVLKDQPEAFLGTKIAKSSPGCPVPEEHLDSMGTNNEQSGTEFSFPPPLWSDPCLEFAYKTLTGAIPLDDNLAFEDYIQHQLRTSKPHDEFQSLPDIDMPSFLQNDEIKHGQLSDIDMPDGVRLANGNGLAPPTKQAGE